MQASTVNAIEVLLAHGSTPTDFPNALANVNRGQLINSGVAALETTTGLLTLFGRDLPVVGSLVGIAALSASSAQVATQLADTGTVSDNNANLVEDTFHRDFTDTIPLAEGVSDLPNMQGSGKVRDLWEAASLSTGLQSVLTNYDAATTRAEQLAQIDSLLLGWADTAAVKTMDERGVAVNDEVFEWMQVAR